MSFDSVEDNKAFAEKFGYTFPLLCDTGRRIAVAYGACDSADEGYAPRITFVIDEQGVISHTLPKVDPKSHTDDVLGYVS